MRYDSKGEPHETERADAASSSSLERVQTGRPENIDEVEGVMGDPNPPLADGKSLEPCPVQSGNR